MVSARMMSVESFTDQSVKQAIIFGTLREKILCKDILPPDVSGKMQINQSHIFILCSMLGAIFM